MSQNPQAAYCSRRVGIVGVRDIKHLKPDWAQLEETKNTWKQYAEIILSAGKRCFQFFAGRITKTNILYFICIYRTKQILYLCIVSRT